MPTPITDVPDALVAGAGGTLGEAWMRGLLNGLEAGAGLDFRQCEYYVGTSAGSIVSAVLAAGRRPEAGDEAARAWAQDAPEDEDGAPGAGAGARARRSAARMATAAATPFAGVALAGVAPAGRLVRAAALSAAPARGRSLDGVRGFLDSLGLRFDGRLRIVAVDRQRGRRVVFGSPKAPEASVSDAVIASCAVPWLFEAVRIGGRDYVDGGVWSPTNLDAAPVGRGARVLCLVPTANPAVAGSPLGVIRAFSTTAAGAEAMALRARGAKVRVVVPDAEAGRAMGANLMNGRRSPQVLAAGYRQGRRLAAGA